MSQISQNDLLSLVTEELTYIPSIDQRRLKSAFWARVGEDVQGPLSLEEISQYVSDRRLSQWWHLSGFREWFLNKSEFRDRIEDLAYKMLDVLEEVATNPKQNGSSRIAAAKLVFEIAEKMPSRQQEARVLDVEIGKMSKHELEQFVSKNSKLLHSS
jgi:hypothetical protein